MKISGRKPNVGQSAPAGPARPAAGKEPAESGARIEERAADVELSASLQEVDRARAALHTMPDHRAERVQEIKPLVDDGSYEVPSGKIAKKMVDESLRESARLKGRGNDR